MNCDATPRISDHEVVCHTVESAFKGLEVSAIKWLHLVCAVWKQSQKMDAICPAVFYRGKCLVTMMPVKDDDV